MYVMLVRNGDMINVVRNTDGTSRLFTTERKAETFMRENSDMFLSQIVKLEIQVIDMTDVDIEMSLGIPVFFSEGVVIELNKKKLLILKKSIDDCLKDME